MTSDNNFFSIGNDFDKLGSKYDKNKLVISSENISRGIYWFTINNHPEIKPLKLVVK